MKQNFLALKLLKFTFSTSQYSLLLYFLTASALILASLCFLNYQHMKINTSIVEILSIGAASLLLNSTTLMSFILAFSLITYSTFMILAALHLSVNSMYVVLFTLGLSYIATHWTAAKYQQDLEAL